MVLIIILGLLWLAALVVLVRDKWNDTDDIWQDYFRNRP